MLGRLKWLGGFMLLLLMLFPSWVYGHANMERSSPLEDAVLKESPTEIRIQYTEKFDVNLSRITMEDDKGKLISGQMSSADNRWLIYSIPKLSSGVYKVKWQVLSVDTHVTDGSFRFSINIPIEKAKPSETISLDGGAPTPSQLKAPDSPFPMVVPQVKPEDTLSEAGAQTKAKPKADPTPVAEKSLSSMLQTPTEMIPPERLASTSLDKASSNTATNISVQPTAPAEAAAPSSGADSGPLLQAGQKNDTKTNDGNTGNEIIAESMSHDHDHHGSGAHIGDWQTPVYQLLRISEVVVAMCISGFLVFRYGIWGLARNTTPFLFSNKNEFKLYLLACVVFSGSGALHVWMLAYQLSGQGSENVWNLAGELLTSTLIGSALWIRPALAGLLIALTWVSKREALWTICMKAIIGVLLIVTYPITGHAFGTDSGVLYPVISHTLHMLTTAIWFGGLVGLWATTCKLDYYEAIYLKLNSLIQRFSTIALPSLLVVSISGLILAYIRLKSWNTLFQSDYGQLVLAKIALLLMVVVIGAFHRLVFIPTIMKSADTNPEDYLKVLKKFVWGVRLEIILAVAVILCAGMLSTTSPPAKETVTKPVYWHVMGQNAHMSMRIIFDEKTAQVFRLDVWLPTGMGAPADVYVQAKKEAADSSLIIPFQYQTGGPDPYGYEGFDKYTYEARGKMLPEKGEWNLSIFIKDEMGQTHSYVKSITVP